MEPKAIIGIVIVVAIIVAIVIMQNKRKVKTKFGIQWAVKFWLPCFIKKQI